MSRRHWIAFAVTAALGAAADLVSKHYAFLHMRPNETLVVVDGFFEIGKTWNRGIVFGLFQSAGTVFLWVSILAVPAIVAIFASLKNPRWIMTASLGLILGGTIGNMYDRITEPGVRDFIKFYYPTLIDGIRGRPVMMKEWPLFNLADSCICVGVVLLSLEMLFFDEKKKKKGAEPAPAAAPAAPSAPTEPVPRADASPPAPTEPIPKLDAPLEPPPV